MARTRTRRWLIAAALLAATAAGGWGFFSWASSPAGYVSGAFTAPGWDGRSTVLNRFHPDGVWVQDVITPGGPPPATTVGRWRVAGRVLILEAGPPAAPGSFAFLTDRFSRPSITAGEIRMTIVSADGTRIVVSHGPDLNTGQDVTETLTRVAE